MRRARGGCAGRVQALGAALVVLAVAASLPRAAAAGAEEAAALLAFKDGLENSSALPTWVQGTDPCSWANVVCSPAGNVSAV